MNKVISLKGLNLKKKRMYTRPKRNLDINSKGHNSDLYKSIASVISVLSVILGAFTYTKLNSLFIEKHIKTMLSVFQGGSFAEIIKLLLLSELLLIACCFVLGTNLFGNIIVGVIPAFKTYLAGYTGAYMYNHFELNGVLFSLIFLVPYISVTCTALIAITNECYTMSKSLSESILKRKTAKDGTLRLFVIRFLFVGFADLLLTVPEALLLTSFCGKINLG